LATSGRVILVSGSLQKRILLGGVSMQELLQGIKKAANAAFLNFSIRVWQNQYCFIVQILNIQADIGLTGEFEKCCGSTKLDTVDKVLGVKVEQVYCHLTGDKSDFSFYAEFT